MASYLFYLITRYSQFGGIFWVTDIMPWPSRGVLLPGLGLRYRLVRCIYVVRSSIECEVAFFTGLLNY